MARQVTLGDLVTDHFSVFESDGYTKKSGESSFGVTTFKDGVVQAAYSVTIDEPDANGEYRLRVTPNAIEKWEVEVIPAYNNSVWHLECEVTQEGVEFGSSMADNSVDEATFVAWLEIKGQRVTDIDSIAAKVMDEDGTEIEDLGTDSTPHAGTGVCKFVSDLTLLTANTPYFLELVAVRGAITWTGNAGFARV